SLAPMMSPAPAPSPTPILVLDRVRKTFAGHIAVDDLSLAVPPGVIYGLLGPNGAGKTTTIRMIMDILQPDAGSVRLFGAPAGDRSTGRGVRRPRSGQRPGDEGHGPRTARSRRHHPVLDPHHGTGRKAVRARVYHRARAEAGGRPAGRHQADPRRTPSRRRVRWQRRGGGTGLCRRSAREKGG